MNDPRIGISSGELFYRQSLGLHVARDEDLRWPRRGIGARLHGFLEEGYDEGTIIAKCEASKRELDEAMKLSREVHAHRITVLKNLKSRSNRLCNTAANHLSLTCDEVSRVKKMLKTEYERLQARIALWYYATLERERMIYNQRLSEETLAVERLKHQVKATLRLSIFALHLESETGERVLLKRLPSAHPQHVRCRRAASENIKPGYFDKLQPFCGINVVDVYKVENGPLLSRFQATVASMEPGKVKGLFTSIPAESVERVVALGMGGPENHAGADGSNISTSDRAAIFKGSWYAFQSSQSSSEGYAEGKVEQAGFAPFPRSYSRYSTLDVDRAHVAKAAADLRLQSSSPSAGLASDDNERDGDGDVDNDDEGKKEINDEGRGWRRRQ